MLRYIARRVLVAIPLLLIVGFCVFILLDLAPGDAASRVAGENATPEEIIQVRERLGLNDNVIVRYGEWLGNAVQGDLGRSLTTPQDVTDAIWSRLPITGSLALIAITITLVVAIPLGVLAALRPNSLLDRGVSAIAALSMALPPFVIGLILVLLFAVKWAWLPATGYIPFTESPSEWLKHLILPALALAAIPTAELARQLRGSLVDALGNDYVRTARAKGMKERTVVFKHALKNAAIPVITVFGLQVGRLLAGSVTIEFIFVLPGFGRLAYDAVVSRDVPMIQGVVIVSAIIVITVNLLVDISYGFLNPRLRQR
ncbi:MAG: ABC transporter permease [Ilumatobacteraceae bacterium]